MSRLSVKAFLSSVLLLSILFNCSIFKSNQESKTNDLVGNITVRQIEESEHNSWFTTELVSYPIDLETLSDFENNPERLTTLSVTIYMGTWCSDSRREVPRFYNIMRFLNVSDLTFIGLDTDKKSPEKLEKGMNIHHVPTFIIYQNGKEINRIIETPVESLEKDLISIIQAKNYTPNYN